MSDFDISRIQNSEFRGWSQTVAEFRFQIPSEFWDPMCGGARSDFSSGGHHRACLQPDLPPSWLQQPDAEPASDLHQVQPSELAKQSQWSVLPLRQGAQHKERRAAVCQLKGKKDFSACVDHNLSRAKYPHSRHITHGPWWKFLLTLMKDDYLRWLPQLGWLLACGVQ